LISNSNAFFFTSSERGQKRKYTPTTKQWSSRH